MQKQIVTGGRYLAKKMFQVHAIRAKVKKLVVQQLRRAQVLKFIPALLPCLVRMEACASAHH